MRRWRITPAQSGHIAHVAARMREADRREVWASSRHTPEEALRASLALSPLAWACLVDGEPAFLWGVTARGGLLSGVGVPWLLGTEAVRVVSMEFARQSRAYVARMQDVFPRLENFVHADNALSRRWLAWCGFTEDAEATMKNGEPFHRFWRNSNV